MGYRLLVVEADSTPAGARVASALALDGAFSLQRLAWDPRLPETLSRKGPHAVIAVAVPCTPTVTQVFETLRASPIAAPTLVVLPEEPAEPLVQLAGQVADDFLLAPIRAPELRHRLGRLLGAASWEVAVVRERLREELGMTQLVGRDPVFLDAIGQVPRFARAEIPVLITGETGTGKELCARAIHFLGKRRDYPFIAVDCGALPDHLIENELFGHARGAYTDAHREQRGLIAMAEGGTLFLDEVDALSLAAQAKLLRFLQDRTFRPLGSDRFHQADVNIIAATNRDVEQCVTAKQFRSDLYFRLNVLRLHLPPLRERRNDIALLASHFLQARRTACDTAARSFFPSTLRALALYDWPGNVRELANVVQRATVACDSAQILPRHVTIPTASGPAEPPSAHFRAARAAAVESFERRYVEDLLRKHGGNVTRAARAARKDRRAFGRLVKKYSIDRRGG